MADMAIRSEAVEMRVVITFNMISGVMAVEGCDKNPVVALGMLDYALARVRRFLTMNDIASEVKNAPRIAVVPRLVE
jgi:hypothetical protein